MIVEKVGIKMERARFAVPGSALREKNVIETVWNQYSQIWHTVLDGKGLITLRLPHRMVNCEW
jgi:hypothetical protein